MSPAQWLDGRICLLTGATGGIGQALAGSLATAGAKLVLTGRDPDKLAAVVAELPAAAVVDTCAADLTQENDLVRVAEVAKKAGVNTLINASGANQLQFLSAQSTTTQRQLIELNLLAPIQLTHYMLPALQQAASPMIVNIGSAFGSIGYPGYAVYCASKFGLRGFSEAMRRELHGRVAVVYVAPRAVQTEMNQGAADQLNEQSGNAVDSPAEVATQVVGAMRHGRAETYLGWPEKFFARLNQILPGLVSGSLVKKLSTVQSVIDAHSDLNNPSISNPAKEVST